MRGMECWTGSFGNAAGRAELEKDLATFRERLNEYQQEYDELNAVNLEKAAEERAQALADSRTLAAKL